MTGTAAGLMLMTALVARLRAWSDDDYLKDNLRADAATLIERLTRELGERDAELSAAREILGRDLHEANERTLTLEIALATALKERDEARAKLEGR